ncbi:MAG: hypothetical protein M3096_01885 [Actinomycetia bacterium]|nr:hypothetical protein [Actinomycetes bacterium]
MLVIADRLDNEARTMLAVVVIGAAVTVQVLATRLSLLYFVNAVVAFGAGSCFLDVPRFYLHGVLFGSAMPILIWSDLRWGVDVQGCLVLEIPESVIIGVGLRKLS